MIIPQLAQIFGLLTTEFTKDTEGLDHKTPNFVLSVSSVMETILGCGLVALDSLRLNLRIQKLDFVIFVPFVVNSHFFIA